MIKLFGHPASTCTRKVLFTLHETNTPFELVLVDFAKGEHKGAAHMARQPWGKLPALDDNGFALFESRAMSRYVDLKSGGKLTPKDPQQHGLMEQWISVETSYFYGPSMTWIYQDVFKRAQPQEELDKATAALDLTCSVLDKHLANHTWLAGEQFSIAEIAYAPYIEYGMMTGAKPTLSKHAHFAAWWNRVSERPAWQKTRG
jgi:glutathione S-transferase